MGIIPIERKFLQRNQLFALEFRQGFVFARTVRRRIVQYKPWPLIDSNGIDIDMAASSTQGELRFRDPRNPANSILYLNSTTNAGLPWILHGAFGIKPQHINMYLRQPEGDIIQGKFPNVDPIRSAAGDNISPINSLMSPYEKPTDYVEVVLQPGIELGAEYFNRDARRNHQPILNILFCVYWFQALSRVQHKELIYDIASRTFPRPPFLQVGFGDFPDEIGVSTQKDWGAEPLTLDEAMALSGRRI